MASVMPPRNIFFTPGFCGGCGCGLGCGLGCGCPVCGIPAILGMGREGGSMDAAPCGMGIGVGCVVLGRTTGRRIAAACINSGEEAMIPPTCGIGFSGMAAIPPISRSLSLALFTNSFLLKTSRSLMFTYLFIKPPRIFPPPYCC